MCRPQRANLRLLRRASTRAAAWGAWGVPCSLCLARFAFFWRVFFASLPRKARHRGLVFAVLASEVPGYHPRSAPGGTGVALA